jgi:hypothetical protein
MIQDINEQSAIEWVSLSKIPKCSIRDIVQVWNRKKMEFCNFSRFWWKNFKKSNFLKITLYGVVNERNLLYAFPNLKGRGGDIYGQSKKIFFLKSLNHARNRLCALPNLENASLTLIQGNKSVYWRKSNMYYFPWIRVKEAFSCFGNARNRFFAWNYPQKYDFEEEIWKFFDFRFNTHIYFPESGSMKHFHASGMFAIDFYHDFTPIQAVLAKNFFRD